MSVFLDILNLLTVSPGGMVYYLVLMFSIWAIVGLALSRWSHGERRGIVPRLLVAGALMSFSRFAFFVVALLDRQNGRSLVLFGPPLERFLDTLSGLLICWAFVIPHRQRTVSRVFIGVTSLFATGIYVIAAMQWASVLQVNSTALYNLSLQVWLWELGQLAFLIPALVYLFVVPAQERGVLAVSLGVLVVGHLLQVVLAFPEQIPHFAGWVRFANLLAFPLLAASTFRLIMQRFDAQAAGLQAINQESLAQITGLMDLLDTHQKMSSSLVLDSVLDNAIRSVSQALQTNLCALTLVSQEAADKMELPIIYHAPNITKSGVQFRIDDYPAIQYAVTRSKPVVLESGESDQVTQIYQLLDSEQKGPLIVQPLQHESATIGLIIVCRPGQSAPFAAVEAHKCETLALHIVVAIENARRYQQMEERLEQQIADLRLLEMEYSRARADLENRLKQSQKEVALYVQKLYETELSEQRAQNDAREARRQLSKLKKESRASLSQTQEELQHSIEQVAVLTQRIARLDATRIGLSNRIQVLGREKEDLQSQLAVSEVKQSGLLTQVQESLSKNHRPRSEELDVSVLDNITCGVILCDPQGQITYVNPIATQLLGLDNEEQMPETVFSLWSDNDLQSALHAVTDQYSTAIRRIAPFVVKHDIRPIQVELAPLNVTGRHVGAAITLYDLHIANEQTRARDEFLASLAQDLRTPMTSILGYTDLLMNESVGQLEGIQRKFLQRVQANIERMGGMLNDIIGVTAIDSGKLAIELEPVDIARVIDSALRKVQFRLEERELSTHLEIGDLPVIYVDADCVQQMMDNLLTNACKSSQTGSIINIQAHIETDDTGISHLHVAVSDTGGGIAPKDRARAFERFYRADNALIAGLGETGVGLSIVKALVEAHQGHVWLESRMGMGTTFHFTLPYGLRQTMGEGVHHRVINQPNTAGGNGHG